MTTRRWLLGVVFVLVLSPLLSFVYSYTRAGEGARVHAATASTLNFQARLLNSSGSLVADGNYSIQFKLYDAAAGGSNEWTETQTVSVKNGYLSAYLGTVTPFVSTINWSQEKWLTMNVSGDGEMTPRIKLTAVPYAFRAGQADTLTISGGSVTGDNLLQKAPGSVQSLNSANAGLRIDQTGSGGLLQLQGNGSNVFTVDKSGNTITSGSLVIGSGLTLGGSSSTTAGTIRWSGTDFEGYVGSSWLSLTGGIGSNVILQNGNSFGAGMTIGTNDTFALNFETDGITNLSLSTTGNLNIINGALQTAGATRIANNGALQNVTADTNILTSGTLGVGRGGTGAATFATNGLLYGNGTGSVQATAAGTSAQLVIANGSGVPTFVTLGGDATVTNTGTLTIGNGAIGNTKLANSSFGVAYGTNLSGDASVSLGGTLNLAISANPTFTSVSTGSVGSTGALAITSGGTSNISLDSASNTIVIGATDTTLQRNAAGTYSIDLNNGTATTLALTNSDAAFAANLNLADGGLLIAGTQVISSARALQNIAGLTVTSAGANITGGLELNGSGITNAGTIAGVAGLTLSSGNLALGGGNITGAGSISGTTLALTGAITGATATNTINGLIINSGSLSGITGFSQTSGNFAISGTGTIDIGAGSNVLTINSTNFDVTSGGALSGITTLGASGAISAATATNTINGLVINSGSLSSISGFAQASGNFGISGTGTFATGTGAVSLNGATNISTTTNSAVALTVNGTSGTAATALQIAQTGNAANLVLTNTARTSGALISMTQNTSAFTGTGLLFNFASGSGSFASGNFLDFQVNGATRFKIDNTGAVQIRSDSATALQVSSANGTLAFFTVNDTGNLVQIGSSTTDATAILSVLDSYNNATDPAGTNGGSYYNSANNKLRCYENSAWKDCITSTKSIKTANQTITNNATFQNDTDLKFTMVANGYYTFNAAINFSTTSAAADFKYTFTVPVGASVGITTIAPTGAAATTTCVITTSGQTCTLANTADYRSTMEITGYVANGVNAGDTQFQFAQNNATTGQSVTVYRGSSLFWDRTQ